MRSLLALLCLTVVGPAPAFAQQRAIVAGGSLTTAVSDGRIGRTLGATAGVQMTPRWRAAFEFVQAPKLKPQFVHILVAETDDDDDSWTDVTAFLGTVRADLRPGRRWSPFVSGGLGAARVTNVFYVVYFVAGPNPIRSSRMEPAGLAGAGVSVRLVPKLALEFEASWLGIATDPFRDLGRFGVAATYAF